MAQILWNEATCPREIREDSICFESFTVLRTLGSGSLSQVFHTLHKKSNIPVALKIYAKDKLSELSKRQIIRELEIHITLNHPAILSCYGAFESQESLYLMLEYAPGGDLFHEVKKKGGKLSERQAVSRVLYPVMSALEYLHDNDIMHRDLKPENLVSMGNGEVKLCDFGLSINISVERPVTRLGTLDYMSPEILRCPKKRLPEENKEAQHLWYTKAADVWAIGVLAFELIVGKAPFEGRNRDDVVAKVSSGRYSLPPGVSPAATAFIDSALQLAPEDRPSMTDLMLHPWIRSMLAPPPAQVTAAVQQQDFQLQARKRSVQMASDRERAFRKGSLASNPASSASHSRAPSSTNLEELGAGAEDAPQVLALRAIKKAPSLPKDGSGLGSRRGSALSRENSLSQGQAQAVGLGTPSRASSQLHQASSPSGQPALYSGRAPSFHSNPASRDPSNSGQPLFASPKLDRNAVSMHAHATTARSPLPYPAAGPKGSSSAPIPTLAAVEPSASSASTGPGPSHLKLDQRIRALAISSGGVASRGTSASPSPRVQSSGNPGPPTSMAGVLGRHASPHRAGKFTLRDNSSSSQRGRASPLPSRPSFDPPVF